MNHDRKMFSFLIQPASRADLVQLQSWYPQERQSSSGGIAMVDGSFREKQRWDMVDKWFLGCLQTHEHCNAKIGTENFASSRAIYIPSSATDATTHYKLVSTSSLGSGGKHTFITLSHVWVSNSWVEPHTLFFCLSGKTSRLLCIQVDTDSISIRISR
jgi:hypothetical protein